MAGVGHFKRIWKDAFSLAGAVQRDMFIRDVIYEVRALISLLHFGASDLQVC